MQYFEVASFWYVFTGFIRRCVYAVFVLSKQGWLLHTLTMSFITEMSHKLETWFISLIHVNRGWKTYPSDKCVSTNKNAYPR